MNKIPSWKLEVIHFSAEDIIVTSGAIDPAYDPIFSRNSNNTYVTSGIEFTQGGYQNYSDSSWYKFNYDYKNNTGFKNISAWTLDPQSTFYYAWFKETDNTWFTETRRLKDYKDGYPY